MFVEDTTLPELTRSDLPGETESSPQLDLVIAEPNFSLSLLPWHNLLVWYCLDQILGPQRSSRKTMPIKAELWAVPVHYEDLWKIRAPLDTVQAGGFQMKPFDDIIMVRNFVLKKRTSKKIRLFCCFSL